MLRTALRRLHDGRLGQGNPLVDDPFGVLARFIQTIVNDRGIAPAIGNLPSVTNEVLDLLRALPNALRGHHWHLTSVDETRLTGMTRMLLPARVASPG
jgi:hypothetical protein